MQTLSTILGASMATPMLRWSTICCLVFLPVSIIGLVRAVRRPGRRGVPTTRLEKKLPSPLWSWVGIPVAIAFWLIPPVQPGWIVTVVLSTVIAILDTVRGGLIRRHHQTTPSQS
jgi:hypothetical protein